MRLRFFRSILLRRLSSLTRKLIRNFCPAAAAPSASVFTLVLVLGVIESNEIVTWNAIEYGACRCKTYPLISGREPLHVSFCTFGVQFSFSLTSNVGTSGSTCVWWTDRILLKATRAWSSQRSLCLLLGHMASCSRSRHWSPIHGHRDFCVCTTFTAYWWCLNFCWQIGTTTNGKTAQVKILGNC